MKPLLAFTVACGSLAGLIGCAEESAPPTASTGLPYAAYATSSDLPGPRNSGYRNWTTAQLQERRKDLYYTIPQRQTQRGLARGVPGGIPEYISRGDQLPQQDEIRAIEGELNRRYRNGDKAAILKPVWPEERRHV